MKIVLVMSEASLWKPEFVQSLMEKMPGSWQVVAAVLTKFHPKRVPLWRHLTNHFLLLGFHGSIIIATREVYCSLADMIDRVVTLSKPYSIAGVCRRYGVPTLSAKDVNSPETISWIKGFNPDILLSSGNQIFGNELLAVPKKACLNRHTSLLPAYGGVYPIFWCMLNNEREVGISVHTMTSKIDEGIVLAQKSLPIESKDTFFSLFAKCFRLGVDVVIEAMGKVDKNDFQPVLIKRKRSYYSMPKWKDVRRFHKMGRRML